MPGTAQSPHTRKQKSHLVVTSSFLSYQETCLSSMVNGFACWWSGTGSLLLLFHMCFLSFLFLDFLFLFLAVLFSKQQSVYNQTGKEEGEGEQIYTENGIFYYLRDGIRIYFWQFLTICSVPGKDKLVCCSSCYAAMMRFLSVFLCFDL